MLDQIKELRKKHDDQKHLMKFHIELLAKAMKLIANYGWYISENIKMNEISECVKIADEGNEENLNNFFSKYYTKNMKENIKILSVRFPEREKIFKEGYKAHKSKLFHSSTLLWLTLCDSICDGELFKLRGNKKAIKKWLEKNKTPETYTKLLEVITEPNAIDAYTGDKQNYKSQLNRHGIMHGYDIDYGKKLNSLKAFSLLVFIKDMVNRHKRY